MNELDIKANRQAAKYTSLELVYRVGWMLAMPLFRLSFRTMFGWRNFLLRLFGARIGEHVHIYNSATIYMPWNLTVGDYSSIGEHAYIYNLGHISIGSHSTVSHKAHLCAGTHDYSLPDLPLMKPEIKIGSNVWICSEAFVGPGLSVGDGVVLGARAVLTKTADDWMVYAGHPAKALKPRNIN